MKSIKSFFIAAICSLLIPFLAQAQAPVINSFSQNGTLIATNLMPGTAAAVEWASSLAGPWHTNWNGLDVITVAGNGTITSSVPMFYRLRGLPRIPPTASTAAASGVTSSGATFNGSGNPNGASATGWFRYSTVNPGTGNDSFGTRAPSSGGSALGSGTVAVAFSQSVNGLLPGATYYYCAIVQTAEGTAFGAIQSFTTPVSAPSAATSGTSNRTGTSATLNGSVNPNGANTAGWFRYSTISPGTPNDTFGTRAPASGGSAVGSGNSSVAFSQNIAGLTAGTTYFYCAIATNSAGTGFGSLQTFTTPLPPTTTTTAASAVSGVSATLNASANPNGATSTGWFRYSTSNPGVANDVAGTRAPSSGGTALGSGTVAQNYSQTLSGLIAGTTYYYWSIVSSPEGTAFGAVLSFTTPSPPAATTTAATGVTASAATLNGTGDPNLASATGWFRYSTSDPGVASDSFGTRAPSSGGSALGSGNSAVSFSQAISGLLPGTTYYYCAIVQTSEGTAFGAIQSFTTPANPPTAATSSTSNRTGTSATLNGSVNPNGANTAGWFRYSTISPGTPNDTFGTRAPASGGSAVGSGNSSVAFSQNIAGLTAGTTYFYCAIATNSAGTGFGSLQTFTTPLPPTAATATATLVTSTTATLNGTGTPNGASATGWFRYSTSNPGAGNDVAGTRAPAAGGSSLGAGSSPVAYSQAISGLTPAKTYFYWAVVQSAEGTAFGAVQSFTTP
ncbi:MAG: hypothetical protein U1F83_05070 [Verrucomicrobiota bacterium]